MPADGGMSKPIVYFDVDDTVAAVPNMLASPIGESPMNAMNPIDSYDAVMYELPDTAVADLLQQGFGVNQADSCGQFLLPLACRRLHLQSVLFLLASGADTELRDPEGNTALLCAIDVSQHNPAAAYEIVKALIAAGADLEARGYMDKTPFLKACSRGCLEILRHLVSQGCNIHAEAKDVVNTSGLELAEIFHTSTDFQQYVRSLYRP
jgi:ankyrin repeat protein